jgi:hypothetical protein
MNTKTKIKKFIIKRPLLLKVLVPFINIKTTGTVFVRMLTQPEKVKVLLDYAKKIDCKIFVETGTCLGDTLYSCKDSFDELFSIELSHKLFIDCQNRFLAYSHIHVFEGDSGVLLPKIVEGKKKTILFWLDAHYSGGETARGEEDSPVVKELDFILKKVPHFCVLIDDARCFTGKNSYPTIGFLKKMIENHNRSNKNNILTLQVKNDIIRITQA